MSSIKLNQDSTDANWQATGILTNGTSTAVKTAGSSSTVNYATGLEYQITAVGAVGTTFGIFDGSTVLWQSLGTTTMPAPMSYIFQTPLKGSAATAMNVKLGATATTLVYNIRGYQA